MSGWRRGVVGSQDSWMASLDSVNPCLPANFLALQLSVWGAGGPNSSTAMPAASLTPPPHTHMQILASFDGVAAPLAKQRPTVVHSGHGWWNGSVTTHV